MSVISSSSVFSANKFFEVLNLISVSEKLLSQIPYYVCVHKIEQPNGNYLLKYLDEQGDVVAQISAVYTGVNSYKLCLDLGPFDICSLLTEDDEVLLQEDGDPLSLEQCPDPGPGPEPEICPLLTEANEVPLQENGEPITLEECDELEILQPLILTEENQSLLQENNNPLILEV